MRDIAYLEGLVRQACPEIDGISIGLWADKTTWRIDFRQAATQLQRDAALAALQSYNPDVQRPVLPVEIELELARRVNIRFPRWRVAQAIGLQEIFRINGAFTTLQAAQMAAISALCAWVMDARRAADLILAMTPIPQDYADDARWPP